MANIITKFDGWNAVVHLPASYATGTKTYPTIVFFPGAGEIGTDVNKLRANGPNAYIDKGWDGTVTVDGKKVEFIVVSIQPVDAYPRPAAIRPKLNALFSQYRVNKDFVLGTGLSRGAWNVNNYALFLPTATDFSYQKTFKVVVSAMGQKSDDNFGVGLPWPNGFKSYATQGGKELNIEQKNDTRGGDLIVKAMNEAVAGSGTYILTNFGNGGHNSWERVYGNKTTEPNQFLIEGKNQTMYEWFGRIAISTATVPNQPPVVSAGADQIISLPTNTTTFTAIANDPDGTIASYNWYIQSGSCLLTNFTTPTVTVSNFIEGDIELKVDVTDNSGEKISDSVRLTVLPDPLASVITTTPSST